MARNMMSNHTDMQEKYCGHVQYKKGNHKRGVTAEGRGTSFVVAANGRHLCILALNRVNVVAVTTILVLHVGVIGHHVPCRYDFMFPRRSYHARLRARGVRGALPPGRGVSLVLTLNRVNIVAVTTILVLHVGVIGHHVPRH